MQTATAQSIRPVATAAAHFQNFPPLAQETRTAVASGLEAGWKNQPSIMAGGFGAVEAEKGANHAL